MNTKNNIKIGYKILKIYTSKFNFTEELTDEDIDKLILKNKIEISINTNINLVSDEELVIDIIAKFKNTETDIVLIEHSGRTCFGLNGVPKGKETDDKTQDYNLPRDLVAQLFSLAYSHSRVLLVNELNPTVFKFKFFLPIISGDKISKILKNPKKS